MPISKKITLSSSVINVNLLLLDIIVQLNLLHPIYRKTTNYGHFAKRGLPWEDTGKVKELLKAIR